MEKKTISTNRKAFHNFEMIETVESGLVLAGFEIKSLRKGEVNLTDGFVTFNSNEAFIDNMHIAPYAKQSTHIIDYDSKRRRKLLLHKTEIVRLCSKVREKGLSIVPLEIYFNDRGKVKLKIGLAKGKRLADKRDVLRQRDVMREVQREMSSKKL